MGIPPRRRVRCPTHLYEHWILTTRSPCGKRVYCFVCTLACKCGGLLAPSPASSLFLSRLEISRLRETASVHPRTDGRNWCAVKSLAVFNLLERCVGWALDSGAELHRTFVDVRSPCAGLRGAPLELSSLRSSSQRTHRSARLLPN